MRTTSSVTQFVAVGLLALALGLTGCGGGGGGAPLTLSGVVRDDGSLAPVAGARVAANTGQATTADANGQFALNGLSAQTTSLTVAALGYETASVPVRSGGGSVSVGNVYLRPAALLGYGNITGTVTEAGAPADGAILQAGVRQAVSKPDGTYTVYNVAVGSQTLVARSADAVTGGSVSVTVANRATVTANVILSSSPPPPPPL